MGQGDVYRRNANTAARIVDGLTFVITPHDNKLHTLNRTATALWELAGDGCTTAGAAAKLTEKFKVELERATADVSACFVDLVDRGILIREEP